MRTIKVRTYGFAVILSQQAKNLLQRIRFFAKDSSGCALRMTIPGQTRKSCKYKLWLEDIFGAAVDRDDNFVDG